MAELLLHGALRVRLLARTEHPPRDRGCITASFVHYNMKSGDITMLFLTSFWLKMDLNC